MRSLALATWTVAALSAAGMNTTTGHAASAQTTSQPLEVCIGGLDHPRCSELKSALEEHQTQLPKYKAAGMTSHESYVRWSMIEPQKGKFDFSYFDTLLDAHKKNGVRWVPFLIAGSAYTLPDWYYKGKDDRGYVCLEHNQRSDIQSLWNPLLRPHVERVVRAFCKHYADNPQLEGVLLGITGNYGESIYPASDPDWTQDLHGPHHAHCGWWCADPDAVKSFQKYSARRYKSLDALNRDWGTTFTAISEIRPRLPMEWPTSAPRQLQTLWYQESMTNWAKLWMQTAKKAMPRTDVYLVVGGHAPASHGMDISAQARAAAKTGCGLRVTNEADNYGENFAITRMVASACRQYGTFFSIEPAGLVTGKGIAGRVFNATASGAKNIHWYPDNLFTTPTETLARWQQLRPYLRRREPLVDVAVFYPRRWMNLRDNDEVLPMYGEFAALRNGFDYDFVDEQMMEDLVKQGKPTRYKFLLVRGGSVEDEVTSRALKRFASMPGAPKVITFASHRAESAEGEQFVRDLARQVHLKDEVAWGVYFSRFADGSVLFLNRTEKTVDLAQAYPSMVHNPLEVAPYSLAEVKGR